MGDPATDLMQAGAFLVLLLFLLFCLQCLQTVGAFSELNVVEAKLPRLLLATVSTSSHPHVSETMHQIGQVAATRGVTEETTSSLHPPPLSRGQLIGVYTGPPNPLATVPASHGVIIETGNRVSQQQVQQWQSRFDDSHGGASLHVHALSNFQALMLAVPVRPGRFPEFVAKWRALRRLARRAKRAEVQPRFFLQAYSPRHGTLLVAIPLHSDPLPQ